MDPLIVNKEDLKMNKGLEEIEIGIGLSDAELISYFYKTNNDNKLIITI
jgi:hypothetical protein